MTIAAPYPADTRAKGWRFEINMEQAKKSDTWLRARSGYVRAHLLLLWSESWEQTPCGSLPGDDELIALLLDMDTAEFAKHKAVLMRGWCLADDGRYYHDIITARVLSMMNKRRSDADRAAGKRRIAPDASTPEVAATPAGVPPKFSTEDRGPRTDGSSPAEKKAPRKRSAAVEPETVTAEVLEAVGIDPKTAVEFIAHKAKMKAPLTERAWKDHLREAAKAGWSPEQAAEKVMARSWKAFEAKYVADERAPAANGETLRERSMRQRVTEMAPGVARKPPGATHPMETIDAIPIARLVG